jgi:membrane protein YdbS with pleckstrin-like domain
MDYQKGTENNVKLVLRLMIMITIVVAATDLIVYYHLTQHPERLTLPFVILVIVVTVVPIGIITSYWHTRKWL